MTPYRKKALQRIARGIAQALLISIVAPFSIGAAIVLLPLFVACCVIVAPFWLYDTMNEPRKRDWLGKFLFGDGSDE